MLKSYFKKIEEVRDVTTRRPREKVILDHHGMTREERLYFDAGLIKLFSRIMREDTPIADRYMMILSAGQLGANHG